MDLDVHFAAVAARDPDAFGDWAAAAEPALRRSLRSFASAVDVEAVLQEALLRVWQVAPKVTSDGRPNALLRFALRVARNAAVDEARRCARAVPEAAPEPEAPEPELPDPALRARIEKCRAAMKGPPRAAFEARLAGGADDTVLAERVSMQTNTFLKNIGRARALLRECLERAGVVWAEVAG